MKRVLLCTEAWPPAGSGGGVQRPMKFAKYLPEFGYAVEVLTSAIEPHVVLDPTLVEEVKDVPSHRVPRARTRRSRLPGELRRWLDRVNRRRPLPDGFVHTLPALRARAAALHAQRPFDVLFTTSPPHTFSLLGLELKRELGLPWVADFRDEWGKNRRRRQDLTPRERRRDAGLEAACFEGADRIVVTTEVMRRNVLENPRVRPDRVTVLPNGFDPEDLPVPRAPEPSGRLVVLYNGVLNSYRRPETFFEGVRRARRADPTLPLEVRLVTPVAQSRRYVAAAGDLLREGTLRVVDFLPHRRSLEEAARADVLLHIVSGCGPDEEPVPGKLFEYLALGRPILFVTSLDGENARILREAGGAVTAGAEDAASIAGALLELGRRWRENDLRTVPRDVARYTRRHLASRLAEIMDPLVSSSSLAAGT